MNLCDIKAEIDKFEEECREKQGTDTNAAWVLLKWIRSIADGLRQATEEEIKSAYRQYGSVDVQVDGNAMASASDQDGVWVQAWVYIYPAEEDNDD